MAEKAKLNPEETVPTAQEGVVQEMHQGSALNAPGVVQEMHPNNKKVNNKNITIQDEPADQPTEKPVDRSYLSELKAKPNNRSYLDALKDSAQPSTSDITSELLVGSDDEIDYNSFPQLRDTFDPARATAFAEQAGLNPEDAKLASELAQTTIFGNAAWGETFEDHYKDNTALSLAMGTVKAFSGGAGGIMDIFADEDNTFNKKYEELDSIQSKGLMEAMAEGDKDLFYLRSVNKGVGDVGGNLFLMGGMMRGVNALLKGKKLQMVAKGKSYKELFKITTLRSTFMGAYALATTTGDLETRSKAAAMMAGMSMTPAFTSLSKTNWGAILKDIAANATLTTAFRWEDAEARADSMARAVAGEGATASEFWEIKREFLMSEAIQNYGPDVVFGAMTRRVEGQVKIPEKVPVLGGFEFIQAQKPKVKGTTRKERRQIAKEPEQNAYSDLAKKVVEGGVKDSDMAPTKAAEVKFGGTDNVKTGAERQKKSAAIIKRASTLQKEGKARRHQIYTTIAESLKVGQKSPKKKEAVTRDPRGVKKALDKGRDILREFSRMDEMADELDGGKGKFNGTAHKAMIDNVRTADASSLKVQRQRKQAFDSVMRSVKLNPRKLGKMVHFHKGYGKMSISELMGAYAKSKQEGGRRAVLGGNFKGDRAAYRSAIKYIEDNPALKKVADYIIADYAQTRSRIAKTYETTEGKALADIDYYVPLNRKGVEFTKGNEDIKSMLEGSSKFDTATMPKGQFQKRKASLAEVRLDLVGEWMNMVGKMENYIHQAENVQVINGVAKRLGGKIEQKHGKSMVEEIKKYGERVANPEILSVADGATATVMKQIRKNSAIGYLAFNYGTVMKQLPSYSFYLQGVGSGAEGHARLAKSIANTATNWGVEMVNGKPRIYNAEIRYAEKMDEAIRSTTVDSVINDFRTNHKSSWDKIQGKIGEEGLRFVIMADKVVRASGWNATYNRYRTEGATHAEAVRQARNVTARTQPTNRASELASIYQKGEYARTFLLFTNQLGKIMNGVYNRMPKHAKNFKDAESRDAMYGIIASTMLSGVGIWSATNGKLPETEEEIKDMLASTFFNASGPVGGVAGQVSKGYDYEVPAAAAITQTVQTAGKLASGDDIEFRDIDSIAASVIGIPVTGTRRHLRAIEKGDPSALFYNKKEKKPFKFD